MASAILVVGGTPMMPGFIPRLHAEIVRALSPPPSSQLQLSKQRKGRLRPPPYDRYAPLRQLSSHFAILNNPNPPKEKKGSESAQKKSTLAGKAPAFTPACMAWVGGSLAGYVTSLRQIPPPPPHVLSYHSWQIIKDRGRRDTQREMGGGRHPRGSRDRGWGCHNRAFLTDLASLQSDLTGLDSGTFTRRRLSRKYPRSSRGLIAGCESCRAF